jgi:hypothetical protein
MSIYNKVVDCVYSNENNQVLDLDYNNSNYFYVLRKDNKNGFQLSVSPNNNLELFMIVNNKISKYPTHQMKNEQDIINFLSNCLMIDYTVKNKIHNIYNLIINKYNNYVIKINKYTISLIEQNSQNGYYIYFDFKTYANIGYVVNNIYFDTDSKKVNSLNEVIVTLNSLIYSNNSIDSDPV